MVKRTFIFLTLVILFIPAACNQAQTTLAPVAQEPSPTVTNSSTPPAAETFSPSQTDSDSPSPSVSADSRILWISSSTDLFNRVISVDPGNPLRLAHCAPDEIRLSLDGGQTWEQAIPTQGVAAVAEENGYTLYAGDPSSSDGCISVAFDPQHPSTFYSVFTVAQEQFGAPPVFYMGFFTTDNGKTWQQVPPPASLAFEDFGGFWNLGHEKVEAMFTVPAQNNEPAVNVAVQETIDGGEKWTAGELSCPKSGPCIRWGPAASNIPGMGSPLPQVILVSSDAGQTWKTVDPPVELRAPNPNQLVAYSDQEIAIISGAIGLSTSEFKTSPLRYSQDNGLTWQDIELPSISLEETNSQYFPGLQILPDESYITQIQEGGTWLWLDPTMPIWCPVNLDRLPQEPQLLQIVGDQLWWVNGESNQTEQISLTEITCAGS